MNLVLRPRRVWAQLRHELDRDSAEPLVFILRSGDLAQPSWLANFRFVTERLSSHPRMRNCRFVRVDRAVQEFAKAQPVTATHTSPRGGVEASPDLACPVICRQCPRQSHRHNGSPILDLRQPPQYRGQRLQLARTSPHESH